jgi:fucose 4-O-acetylase-like acetyltransferase
MIFHSAPDGRLAWIDVAKGIGIILVVFGHVADSSDHAFMKPLMWFVFLFHMPLFFILSGYVYKPKDDWEYVRAKARSLLVPYFAYLIPIFLVTHAKDLLHIREEFAPLMTDVVEALYGGRLLTVSLGVFWFVTCLFLTQISYNFLVNRIESGKTLAVVISVLALVGLLAGKFMNDFTLPWALTVVPVAMACFAFGDYLRRAQPSDRLTGLASAYVILISTFI